jgi:hypothetical protein
MKSAINQVMAGKRTDIDVAKLLCDIGEASANASPVDLFGLCLRAQRVLDQVIDASDSKSSISEAALLTNFRAMNYKGQDYTCGMARQLLKRFPRQLAALTLVQTTWEGDSQ